MERLLLQHSLPRLLHRPRHCPRRRPSLGRLRRRRLHGRIRLGGHRRRRAQGHRRRRRQARLRVRNTSCCNHSSGVGRQARHTINQESNTQLSSQYFSRAVRVSLERMV
eukprot:scaffold638_cov66-Phaeocystis_antarctica.AAC.1